MSLFSRLKGNIAESNNAILNGNTGTTIVGEASFDDVLMSAMEVSRACNSADMELTIMKHNSSLLAKATPVAEAYGEDSKELTAVVVEAILGEGGIIKTIVKAIKDMFNKLKNMIINAVKFLFGQNASAFLSKWREIKGRLEELPKEKFSDKAKVNVYKRQASDVEILTKVVKNLANAEAYIGKVGSDLGGADAKLNLATCIAALEKAFGGSEGATAQKDFAKMGTSGDMEKIQKAIEQADKDYSGTSDYKILKKIFGKDGDAVFKIDSGSGSDKDSKDLFSSDDASSGDIMGIIKKKVLPSEKEELEGDKQIKDAITQLANVYTGLNTDNIKSIMEKGVGAIDTEVKKLDMLSNRLGGLKKASTDTGNHFENVDKKMEGDSFEDKGKFSSEKGNFEAAEAIAKVGGKISAAIGNAMKMGIVIVQSTLIKTADGLLEDIKVIDKAERDKK